MYITTSISLVLALASQLPLGTWATPIAADQCDPAKNKTSSCKTPLKLAVLGDSLASGVTYRTSVEFDKNKDACMRNIESYGVQLNNDNTWAGRPTQLQFAACSGAKMFDIVAANGTKNQIHKVNGADVLLLSVGSNDIGLFPVVDSCIYHSIKGHDYGPAYDKDPKRVGDRAKAIDSARDYMKKNSSHSLSFDLHKTYTDLLNSSQAKSNPKLRIYQTGLAHYFNLNQGSEYCDNLTFRPFGPNVGKAVRADMNELIEQANRVIERVTSGFAHQNVGYISITEKFNGHRFCERGHSATDQFSGDKVWFWNFSIPPWLKAHEGSDNGELDAPAPQFYDDALVDFSKPGDTATGFKERPFHPKKPGYTAVKDAIIHRLKADKVV